MGFRNLFLFFSANLPFCKASSPTSLTIRRFFLGISMVFGKILFAFWNILFFVQRHVIISFAVDDTDNRYRFVKH